MGVRVILKKEHFTGVGIVKFYDNVAKVLGYENVDKLTYDCKLINVAKNIEDSIFDYMASEGNANFEIGMVWVVYGPKVDETLQDGVVDIEPGFITEVE